MKIINPATEELVGEVAVDSTEAIKFKYENIRAGQAAWAAKPLQERLDIIVKFGEIVDQHVDRLAALLTAEMGKPVWQAAGEIKGAKNRVKFLVDLAEKTLAEDFVTPEGATKEKIVYEPLGVIGNISAWNYPYNVGYNVYLPALVAGNAVLYKPSEYTALTGIEMAKMLWEAGVPEDVFQVVIGGKEAGQTMLDLPLDGYFFTGSYRTGKHIAQTVAHKLVPVGLELGGKDPLYVAEDVADVANVAAAAAEGVFYNTGQSCCAVERIYVNEKVYDQFITSFVEETKKLKSGSPMEEGVWIGPLTRPEQIDVIQQQVDDAVSKGGKLLLGGKKMEGKGYYYEPTVVVDVTNDMPIMQEESFGPVIGIMKVSGDEEAVKLMNDTEYGLTAAVYTQSKERAEKMMAKLNAGTVYWNCCDRVSPYTPWSGRKNSGMGSTLSHIGIRAFVQPKAYHLRG
ncbi:MAG: aldehyde dehydrogenase family protein [Sphingobacteriales bacterium JAD_PAG50586_3]|nr:MAG: aldehyde dehydrogenase family protein [Sphingobacteriales bacterium JAD_PAG50586_3]